MAQSLQNEVTAHRFSERKLTWKSIKDSIPASAYANPTLPGLLYFFRDIIVFVAIFSLLYVAESWYFLLPLWLLAALSISSLFVIGHDAAHGALFKSKRLSWWIGQISMLPSLHAYHQWCYGHNRVHHGHTIKLESDFVWHPASPAQYQKMNVFQRMLHRLYWSPVGAGPYYFMEIWFKGMLLYTAPQKGALRDKLLVLGFLLGVSAGLFLSGAYQGAGFDAMAGLWMWTKMFLVPFIGWNYTMGFTVYVHHINDQIPWKDRKDWSPAYGQLFGTVNYHIPAFFNFFFHNIFIHMPHHVQVRIPFYNLNNALEGIKSVYGEYVIERKTVFRDYFRSTLKCKLFDAEKGRWLTYREAKQSGLEGLREAVSAT
ncbi:MAG: fatty acid desaturase [Leptospiraceae bacterium]|nr:fatty acid desaturase [Leptospiraceae bacterium]